MILRRRVSRRARIEIIPMIDVVFFLLVFFMMASLSMAVYSGMPVSLPRAATGLDAPADSKTITVTRDGGAYLDREPMTLAELGAALRSLAGANPALAVVINADEEVTHGRVVSILDEVRAAGVARLAIAIRPEVATRGGTISR
jgi:biopolymer transport protein ExbD